MKNFLRRNLLFFLAMLFLFASLFFGINYFEKELASISSVITVRVMINPLEINTSTLDEIEINKTFIVTAEITNKGPEKIENAKGEIFLAQGLVLVKGHAIQEMGTIPAESENKQVVWSVRAEEAGEYIISVSVSGELGDETVEAEDSALVKIQSFSKKGFIKKILDFFSNLF